MQIAEAEQTPEDLAVLVSSYPRGRVPRELRHRQILAVATDVFSERGFASTSMDEVARRVGVSKPVIYELVGSKEQLFREIVGIETARIAARVEVAVGGATDPLSKLCAGSLAFFQSIHERPGFRALVSVTDGPLTAEVAASRRFHAQSVAGLIARGAAETGIELPAATVDALAHAINGMNEGLALWWNDHPEQTPETLAELASALLGPGLVALQNQLSGK